MIFKGGSWPLLAAFIAMGGACSQNHQPAPPSEMSVAREALVKALDCWRLRIAPRELLAATPSIKFSDEDWNAEHRLVSYELLPGEAPAGPTIRWPVRLRVARTEGREEDLEVVYVISTNPVIHIARQD